jgi:hypothetical protein
VKNKMLENIKELEGKCLHYKQLVSQIKISEIKAKYEHQKKI